MIQSFSEYRDILERFETYLYLTKMEKNMLQVYGYPASYKPKGLTEQTNILRDLIPGAGYVNQELLERIQQRKVPLPKYAEAFFAVMNWEKHPKVFGKNYWDATNRMFELLTSTRAFHNHRSGDIDKAHLRQFIRTRNIFRKLAQSQGNPDILIVPAQLGLRFREQSAEDVQKITVGTKNECSLGTFATGNILLVHPERFQGDKDLVIDCAGDKFASDVNGRFVRTPCFYFRAGMLKFGTNGVDVASSDCGSASALLLE